MADNFLERRMEDYRSGKLSAHSTHHPGRKSSTDAAPALAGLRVIVTDGLSEPLTSRIVKKLLEEGCKVAFMGTDSKEGARFAQASGAQFHPVKDTASADALSAAVGYVRNRWGEVDVIIDISSPHFSEGFLAQVAPDAMKISLTAPLTESAPGVLGAILGCR